MKNLPALFFFLLLSGIYLSVSAKESVIKEHTSFEIVNALTGYMVPDTVTVELLSPDSTVLYTGQSEILVPTRNGVSHPEEARNDGEVEWDPALSGKKLMIRLSHPDYKTTIYHVTLTKDEYRLDALPLRRLSKREKSHMLDEVTVTASKVQFIHRGDTIVYNADAFELAEGSMLSALIKRLPGAELKDNGQIYVNGKFVDRLLLDGKDFFEGDKLVLLQNLPAYTVKNIKVYDETEEEVLARRGRREREFVMDVRLKKEFNAGWLANAEAGGGTHSRYRLRGFGMGYTPKGRIAAHAFMNNINESGSPDMSGEWSKPADKQFTRITRGGGVDYNFKLGKKVELKGNSGVTYQTLFNNTLLNRQYYLPTGDTYLRSWNDSKVRNLNVYSNNTAILDTRTFGMKAMHFLQGNFRYGWNRTDEQHTEGTFSTEPGSWPSMRADLTAGMPDTLGILNRYLRAYNNDRRSAVGTAYYNMFAYNSKRSTSLSAWLSMDHAWQDGAEQYLLQYAGQKASDVQKSNPKGGRGIVYGIEAGQSFRLDDFWRIKPSYKFSGFYNRTYNRYYDYSADYPDNGISHDPLFSAALDRIQMLDPRNSYDFGFHKYSNTFGLFLQYEPRVSYGDRPHLRMELDPTVTLHSRRMNFHGMDSQKFDDKVALPAVRFWFSWSQKQNDNRLMFRYNLKSGLPDMFDMVDMEFTYDPLNPRRGNRNLKYWFQHVFELQFQSRKKYFNILDVDAQIAYSTIQRNPSVRSWYDVATGVRVTQPVNVNGNRWGRFDLKLYATPERSGRLTLSNSLQLFMTRVADMVSTDPMQESQLSVARYFHVTDELKAEYRIDKHMVALEGSYASRHASPRTADFSPYTLYTFSYGVRGLLRLPAGFEFSTNLRMYSTRGFTDDVMNTNQLIWNARLTKSVMGGSLQFAVDGYDILKQVKNITSSLTASYRDERFVNSIPSYVMFTVKYFFAKKPKN